MDDSETLEDPYSLLSIPKPFGSAGIPFSAPVTQYTESSAQKQRSEIVVAIDGEGLYTYDVAKPRLVTSQALPPSARFLCAPASAVWKRSNNEVVRITTAAVCEDDGSQKRLICFTENYRRTGSSAAAITNSQSSKTLDDSEILGIHLHALNLANSEQSSAFSIVIVLKDGHVRCLSGDASVDRWTLAWPESSESKTWIEDARILSGDSQREPLLVGRPDISISHDQTTLIVIVRAIQTGTEVRRSVCIAAITGPARGPDFLSSTNVSMQIHELAALAQGNIAAALWATKMRIHYKDGAFFAQTAQTLHRWLLTQSGSRVELKSTAGISSFIPISASQVLCKVSDQPRLAIYDFQWNTINARTRAILEAETGTKRDRRSSSWPYSNLQLSYFVRRQAAVIALVPGQLLACPVASPTDGNKRRRIGTATLAQVVGRGQVDKHTLSSFGKQIRELADAGRIQDIDEAVAKDLGIPYTRNTPTTVDSAGEDSLAAIDDSKSQETVQWTMPANLSELIQKTNPSRARMVFDALTTQSTDGRLGLRCFPEATIRWLAVVGQLAGRSKGQLMQACADFDDTLATMGTVLGFDFFLDLPEIVRALDIVIESLDSPIDPDSEMAQIEKAPFEEDDAGSINDASAAAENDLAFALASLNYGTAVRGGLLRSIFDRLDNFSNATIVKAFKITLSSRKLVFLINLLRIELADGGWTTRYTDETYEHEEDEGPSDNSIEIIVKLLNAAIDAIGGAGWNVGLSSDKLLNTDEMLLILRAEISAALEGCQDYQSLGASLQEFTKYCNEVEPINARKEKSSKRREIDPIRNPGFLQDDADDPLLPMGSRLDRIEMTRMSRGGEVRAKSKGAIGQEISMSVGRYSIDRIRV